MLGKTCWLDTTRRPASRPSSCTAWVSSPPWWESREITDWRECHQLRNSGPSCTGPTYPVMIFCVVSIHQFIICSMCWTQWCHCSCIYSCMRVILLLQKQFGEFQNTVRLTERATKITWGWAGWRSLWVLGAQNHMASYGFPYLLTSTNAVFWKK